MERNINRLEKIYLRSAPALEEIELDGWMLRFTAGYHYGANCVIPLTNNEGDLYKKVCLCEEEYRKRGLDTTFKILSNTPAKLSAVLENRGYNFLNKTIAMNLDLKTYRHSPVLTDKVHYNEAITEQWIDAFVKICNLEKSQQEALSGALHQIRNRVISAYYFSDEEIKGTCLGIIDGEFLGLFFVGIDQPEKRPKMLLRGLVSRVLAEGKAAGLETAYCRAVSTGFSNIEFFRDLGFFEAYSYIFRQKNSKKN